MVLFFLRINDKSINNAAMKTVQTLCIHCWPRYVIHSISLSYWRMSSHSALVLEELARYYTREQQTLSGEEATALVELCQLLLSVGRIEVWMHLSALDVSVCVELVPEPLGHACDDGPADIVVL